MRATLRPGHVVGCLGWCLPWGGSNTSAWLDCSGVDNTKAKSTGWDNCTARTLLLWAARNLKKYRGGQTYVYICESIKHRVCSCIIIYLFIIVFIVIIINLRLPTPVYTSTIYSYWSQSCVPEERDTRQASAAVALDSTWGHFVDLSSGNKDPSSVLWLCCIEEKRWDSGTQLWFVGQNPGEDGSLQRRRPRNPWGVLSVYGLLSWACVVCGAVRQAKNNCQGVARRPIPRAHRNGQLLLTPGYVVETPEGSRHGSRAVNKP